MEDKKFEDLEFLKQGNYDVCCLMRYMPNGRRQFGYLIHGSWSVILGNAHRGEFLGEIPYVSPESIILDGWLVD